MKNDFMNEAIKQAKKAYVNGDIPIGAVIVKNNFIISKAYNKKNITNIATDHAEIIAINKACKKEKTWRLNNCTMYVTLEPCKMCYAAIAESRIKKVIYLLSSKYNDLENNNFNKINKIQQEDIYNYESLINDFFKSIR